MPRKPRIYLPGVPCDIIQRGNNREATFFSVLKVPEGLKFDQSSEVVE